MANLFGFFAILSFILVAYIGYFNPIENFYVTVAIIFIAGLFSGVFLMYKGVLEGEKYAKRVSKRLEKAVIGEDEYKLKIKTLENKVKSLEIALEKAVKKG